MASDFNSFIRECLIKLMKPVAEFCIERGIHFPDFIEIAKLSFVRAAEHKARRDHQIPLSISKLSVMTGIQRPEINRLRRSNSPISSKDFVTRIIGQWISDERFHDKRRNPRKLSVEGRDSEFQKLVHAISKDLNPHTVKFELERLGLIVQAHGLVSLTKPAYISSGDPAQTLQFAAEDASDLLSACQENAFTQHATPNLHARTQYDNIPDEVIPRIKTWLLELGNRIHNECRSFLSSHDHDINPKSPHGTGRNRVVLGTFSRVEKVISNKKGDKQ